MSHADDHARPDSRAVTASVMFPCRRRSPGYRAMPSQASSRRTGRCRAVLLCLVGGFLARGSLRAERDGSAAAAVIGAAVAG
jgi:hypothetical protein